MVWMRLSLMSHKYVMKRSTKKTNTTQKRNKLQKQNINQSTENNCVVCCLPLPIKMGQKTATGMLHTSDSSLSTWRWLAKRVRKTKRYPTSFVTNEGPLVPFVSIQMTKTKPLPQQIQEMKSQVWGKTSSRPPRRKLDTHQDTWWPRPTQHNSNQGQSCWMFTLHHQPCSASFVLQTYIQNVLIQPHTQHQSKCAVCSSRTNCVILSRELHFRAIRLAQAKEQNLQDVGAAEKDYVSAWFDISGQNWSDRTHQRQGMRNLYLSTQWHIKRQCIRHFRRDPRSRTKPYVKRPSLQSEAATAFNRHATSKTFDEIRAFVPQKAAVGSFLPWFPTSVDFFAELYDSWLQGYSCTYQAIPACKQSRISPSFIAGVNCINARGSVTSFQILTQGNGYRQKRGRTTCSQVTLMLSQTPCSARASFLEARGWMG